MDVLIVWQVKTRGICIWNFFAQAYMIYRSISCLSFKIKIICTLYVNYDLLTFKRILINQNKKLAISVFNHLKFEIQIKT